MKKLFTGVAIGFVLCAAIVFAGQQIVGSLIIVNGSTNQFSGSYGFDTYFPTNASYLITVSNCTATSNVTFNLQLSLDNTNFLTLASCNPTVTNNNAQFVFSPGLLGQTIYQRFSVTATNVGIGIQQR